MGTNEDRDETTKVSASLSRGRKEDQSTSSTTHSTDDPSMKRSRVNWRVHLHICKGYVKKYHHGLVPFKYRVQGVDTGRWLSNQRAWFKEKGLDNINGRELERIKAFDAIGVNLRPKKTEKEKKLDKSFDETFMENYAALCTWRNKHGGFAGVPRSLKSFCTEVRERHQSKGLSEDHITCLASIHFPWTEFDAGLKQLLKFKQVEKHFDVPEDHPCFSWIKEIRKMYRENKLPDMSYQILLANKFQFEELSTRSPQRLNQSTHVKFTTANERPVAGDRRMQNESQGNISSSSWRSGRNKSKAPIIRKLRSDDNDDSDGDSNQPPTHVKFPASNEQELVAKRKMQDESQGHRFSLARRGTNKSMAGHVRSGDDSDDDSDDSESSFNQFTPHAKFTASNERSVGRRMRVESRGQISLSGRRAKKLKGPRCVLSDHDDSDIGSYVDNHHNSGIDIDSDNSDTDTGSTSYVIHTSGGNNGGSNIAKEDEDLENSPFRSNKKLSNKGSSRTNNDGGENGAATDKGGDETNISGSKNEKQTEDGSESDSNGDDESDEGDKGDEGTMTNEGCNTTSDSGGKHEKKAEDGGETSSDGGDEEPKKINMRGVKKMKKDDLVQECKGYGLDSTGTRAVLSTRLYQFYCASPKYNPQNW